MESEAQPNPELAAQMAVERIERLKESHERLVKALEVILPMASGYARAHPVGNNQAFIDQASTALKYSKLNQ